MSDVKKCDRDGCGNTYRDGGLRSLKLELSPFGCGGRRLHQWERELDFCSATCALAELAGLAGQEAKLDEYQRSHGIAVP